MSEHHKSYMDIAREMDLFHMEEHSPGVIFWHPNGFALLERIRQAIRGVHRPRGYQEVKSPSLVGAGLFVRSGHLEKFRESMFLLDGRGDGGYALRPMSCPNHMAIYAHARRSYRDLPLRIFEFGEVFRDEPSGSLLSLFRLRAFCQDDSHIFARQSQVKEEIAQFIGMAREAYAKIGFRKIHFSISLRPEKRLGSDLLWDMAENALRKACGENGVVFSEIPGGGAFYGPKLEIGLEDRQGRHWQMGVIQLDYALPERFGLSYIGEEGKEERPVILHHALFGSLERLVGILLEEFGAEIPLMLVEKKIALLPVSKKSEALAREWLKKFEPGEAEVIAEGGPLPKRVAIARQRHIPYWAVLGPKEEQSGRLSVSGRGIGDAKEMRLEELKELWDRGGKWR